MFCQSVLENLHERFLLFYSQVGGGIQNLCKLRHGSKLTSERILGNYVFLLAHSAGY